MKKPAVPTEEDLINTWIIFEGSENGSQQYEDTFWAFSFLDDLTSDHPEESYEVILKILKKEIPEEMIVSLGCGALESLLSYNGERIIDRLEKDIKSNPKLLQALTHTWKFNTSNQLYERVKKLIEK